jgi:hypothetical protein
MVLNQGFLASWKLSRKRSCGVSQADKAYGLSI